MIPKSAIRLTKQDDFSGDRLVVTAQVSLGFATSIDSFTLARSRMPAGILNHTEQHVVRALWASVYGDLIPPLRELEMHVRRSRDFLLGESPTSALFRQLDEMLRTPTPTTSA